MIRRPPCSTRTAPLLPYPTLYRSRAAHRLARRWRADHEVRVDSSRIRRGVVAMSETAGKLGANEVAAWLRLHPKFLQQFPDLAISMVVPREEGPAASLASYQLEVLRDKNRELTQRLHDLYAIGRATV